MKISCFTEIQKNDCFSSYPFVCLSLLSFSLSFSCFSHTHICCFLQLKFLFSLISYHPSILRNRKWIPSNQGFSLLNKFSPRYKNSPTQQKMLINVNVKLFNFHQDFIPEEISNFSGKWKRFGSSQKWPKVAESGRPGPKIIFRKYLFFSRRQFLAPRFLGLGFNQRFFRRKKILFSNCPPSRNFLRRTDQLKLHVFVKSWCLTDSCVEK